MLSLKQEKFLLSDLRNGRRHAVKRWFKTFAPYLTRLTMNRVNLAEDVEEIVQETFINCLKQLPLFRGEARLKTWMISILRHEIADYYRKRYAKRVLKTIPLIDGLLTQSVGDVNATAWQVRETLTRMTGMRKELLLMKYVEKKSVKEIAEFWRRTVKAIESELFRARREFKWLYLKIERESSHQ